MDEYDGGERTKRVGEARAASSPERAKEIQRMLFENDAKAYGFDLTRMECAAPEPWSEYADSATGHRWAGWLAREGEA